MVAAIAGDRRRDGDRQHPGRHGDPVRHHRPAVRAQPGDRPAGAGQRPAGAADRPQRAARRGRPRAPARPAPCWRRASASRPRSAARGTPLPDAVVLSAAEVATIAARVAGLQQHHPHRGHRARTRRWSTPTRFAEPARAGQIGVGGDRLHAGLPDRRHLLLRRRPSRRPSATPSSPTSSSTAINDQFDGEIPPVNLLPFLFGRRPPRPPRSRPTRRSTSAARSPTRSTSDARATCC